MKKFIQLLTWSFLFILPLTAFNQETYFDEALQPCGQYEATEKMRINDSKRFEEYQKARFTLNQRAEEGMEKAGTVYTIPVVFHVLHNGGSENISKAQIENTVAILNRDFRKLNNDANNVVSQFQSIVGDAEIEFALATIAPDGTCFEGITRTQSSQTSNGDDGPAQITAVINGNDVYQGVWPHNKYLNIVVCKNLISGAAGYTFLPNGNSQATATNMYYNSIFMLSNYVGSIGTGSVFSSRALTHEVGHWLNLSHIWGNGQLGTCGNDNVSDTPKTSGSQPPCDLNQKTCDNTLDNVENYMDYGYCSKMFTNGQVTRMRSALTSSTAGRSNIWKQNNLTEVGVNQSGSSICGLDFSSSQTAICTGSTVNFSAFSSGDPITSYSWSFPGGTPSTSTVANPSVTYNTPGNYDVVFIGTTASGNGTVTKNELISVTSNIATNSLPIVEGFQGTTFPPTNWTINNGGLSNTWERNSSRGTNPTPGNSVMIDMFTDDTRNDVDDLNTPSFSLQNYHSATLTFDVAYKPYNSQYFDKLEVLVSAGCGSPFTPVYSKSGATLGTESANQSGYTNPSVWRNENIDLSAYLGKPAVQVKFRATSGWGNHLYLDNINITGNKSDGTANFSPSANEICTNQSVTFTSSSTNAYSWDWNFGQGANPATATGEGPHTVSYNTTGNKVITLSINNGESSAYQAISVDECAGIDSENISNLQIYPNPNNGVFTVHSTSPIDEIRVNDFIGRTVKVIEVNKENSLLLDLSQLSSGTYYITAKTGIYSKTNRLIIK